MTLIKQLGLTLKIRKLGLTIGIYTLTGEVTVTTVFREINRIWTSYLGTLTSLFKRQKS